MLSLFEILLFLFELTQMKKGKIILAFMMVIASTLYISTNSGLASRDVSLRGGCAFILFPLITTNIFL